MSMYVATRHRIFHGAGNVFCLPATSTMTVQAMQTHTVVDVVFFPLDTLQHNVSMFYPTPTKTRTSKVTLPRSGIPLPLKHKFRHQDKTQPLHMASRRVLIPKPQSSLTIDHVQTGLPSKCSTMSKELLLPNAKDSHVDRR